MDAKNLFGVSRWDSYRISSNWIDPGDDWGVFGHPTWGGVPGESPGEPAKPRGLLGPLRGAWCVLGSVLQRSRSVVKTVKNQKL